MSNEGEIPSDAGPGDPGSIADDLAKLVTALTRMVGDVQGAVNAVAPGCASFPACPVCRVTNMIGNCPPEVGQHLTSAAGSLLLAFNAALGAVKPDSEQQGFEPINLVEDPDQESRDQ